MVDIPALLEGYELWAGDEPFENHAGPFFMKHDPEHGKHLSAFIAEARHMNGGGFLHGGMLMSFADYALFVIAADVMAEGQHSVTVSCQTEFLKGAAPLGQPVFADGEVTRNTRSLIFVRGRIYTENDGVLASFGGILKRVGVA
ncbi:MAG: PaaI family thioesterase [Parvibaculales bacterium]